MTPDERATLDALPDDPPACEDVGREHRWTAWEFGKFFAREERFCVGCGCMETQEIRT